MSDDKAIRLDASTRLPPGYEERGYRPTSVAPRPSRPPQTPPATPPARTGSSASNSNESN